ncbi:MAG: DNA polymerase III subunit epsilon [Chlamydiia bacterium]|nr:DNA polymerase III subunit epsilon [Chlamydiia bacterium]
MSDSIQETIFVCLDCETTGLDTNNDDVIEFAAVKFSCEKGVIEKIDFLVKPKKSIPEETTKIHGIDDKMVKDEKTFDEYIDIIKKFVSDYPIMGHKVSFDIAVLDSNAKRFNKRLDFRKNLVVDTLRLARQYQNSDSNSLTGLCKYFDLNAGNAHRAIGDVLMNIDIFKKLTIAYKDMDRLIETLNKPIKMLYMPFGIHRGKRVSSLPEKYLMYLKKAKDLDEDIKFTINSELKNRSRSKGIYKNIFEEIL